MPSKLCLTSGTLSATLLALPTLCVDAPLSAQQPTAKQAKQPADPHGMRRWQLVLLIRGPKYDEPQGAERKKLFAGHFATISRLAKSGKLRLAGPLSGPKTSGGDSYAGLFLIDAATPKAAAEICKGDPTIAAGVFKTQILTWYGPSDITYRGDPGRQPHTKSLFNGKDLSGWHADIPAADKKPNVKPSFAVRDGKLISLGRPQGHLITDAVYRDYRLVVEWRWPGKPGNCGILVHASKPRMLYKMFPQSIECQLHRNNAGDFWCIGEDIKVPDMVSRRGPAERWGVVEGKARRIKNLTNGSEKPLGEWNQMVIECRGRRIDIWVNGDHVNNGYDCTAQQGQIAIQAEGATCEFRRLDLTPLPPLPSK